MITGRTAKDLSLRRAPAPEQAAPREALALGLLGDLPGEDKVDPAVLQAAQDVFRLAANRRIAKRLPHPAAEIRARINVNKNRRMMEAWAGHDPGTQYSIAPAASPREWTNAAVPGDSAEDTAAAALATARRTISFEQAPGRVEGGLADLKDPAPAAFYFQGTIRGLLDRMAAHSGYDWEWGTDGAPLFYRYWDRNQRAPAPQAVWKADSERHGSLKAVVEAWGAQARWIVVWEAKRDYELGATATFHGSFLDAVDGLLGGRETRRKLLVRVYPANRHLVVENAGRAAP